MNVGEVDIQVDADTSPFEKNLSKSLAGQKKAAGKAGDATGTEFGAGLNKALKSQMQGLGAELSRSMKLAGPLTKDIEKNLTQLSKSQKRANVVGKLLGQKLGDGIIGGIASMTGKVSGAMDNLMSKSAPKKGGRGLGMGVMAAGLAAIIPVITSGISSLAGAGTALIGSWGRAASSGLALVGVLGATVQAAIVAKLAFGGLGKAIEGDAEAMAKLAPAGQKLVTTLQSLGPQWASMRKNVQQVALSGMGRSIQQLSNAYLPMLRTQLTASGAALNGFLKHLSVWAARTSTVEKFKTALSGNTAIFRNLGAAAAPILNGLLNVYNALLPSANRLSEAIGRVAMRFSGWSQGEARAKSIDDFMKRAENSAKIFGGMIGNLGIGLKNVFSIGANSGDSLTQSLSGAFETFRKFTESASGKAQIATWIEGGVTAMKTFGSVLTTIGPVISGLFNPAIFQGFLNIVSGLTPIISSVAGVIQGALAPVLSSIGSALAEHGPKIAGLFVALGPLLKGIGAVIGQVFSQAIGMLGTLAGAITPVVGAISGFLGPIIQKLAPIIAAVVLSFAGWIGAVLKIIPIFGKLSPVISGFFSLIGKMLGVVRPALSVIGRLFAAAFSRVGAVIRIAANAVRAGFNMMRNIVMNIMRTIATRIRASWQVIRAIVGIGVRVVVTVVRTAFNVMRAVIGNVMRAIGAVIRAVWNAIRRTVMTVVNGIRSGVSRAWNAVKSATSSAWNAIKSAVTRAWTSVKSAVTKGITNVISTVRSLPGKVKSALGNLGSTLFNAGQSLIQGLINGIQRKIESAVQAVKNGLNRIKSLLPGSPIKDGPLKSWNRGGAGIRLANLLTLGLRKGIPGVVKAGRDLVKSIPNPAPRQIYGSRLGIGAAPATSLTGSFASAVKPPKKASDKITPIGTGKGNPAAAPVVFPKVITLRIGDQDFMAYVGNLADQRIEASDSLAWQGV